MTELWWLGAIVAFASAINLVTYSGTLKEGLFWLTSTALGALMMYGSY